VQYIDINTCRPVQGALVDIWQANATGVYRYASFPIRTLQETRLTNISVESQSQATTLQMAGTRPTYAASNKQTATA
jgi:protocatechuate 3,4-dioxygenase beta subunit